MTHSRNWTSATCATGAYTNLSGGERQLVLIARALAQEAPILILDEPTSHLDFRNQILILNKVREIVRQKGLTVLMTLHDPNLAMQFFRPRRHDERGRHPRRRPARGRPNP